MIKSPQHNRRQEIDSVELVQHPVPAFGVAIFDESRDSGWAKLAEGEPFRFRGPEDLQSDCVWVCQSDDQMFRDRYRGQHHLRNSDYLSKLSYIAADLGLRVDGSGKFGVRARDACEALAPTINRAIVIAAQAYGWTSPSQRLKEDTLMEDLRKALVDSVSMLAPKSHMRGPLQAAYQSYSSVDSVARQPPGAARIALRFNRMSHARRVMATRIPDGTWNLVDTETRGGGEISLAQALDPEQPCLVRATVEFAGHDAAIAALCAYGNQPKRSVLRAWMCQRELAWLSKHARVHIGAIWFAETSHPISRKLQLPECLTADPVFQLSLPVGLVAEAHWRGLCKDYYKPSVEGKREVSAAAVWLRAADRAYCFELAMAAHRAGFLVSGYGNGSVGTVCEPSRLPELLDMSMDNDVAHPVFGPIFQEFGLIEGDGDGN